MSFLFSSTKYSTNVTTSNWLATGHDGTDAMVIGGSGKLILSASNGVIHASGALDSALSPDINNYHFRAVNSHLILSSSAGSIVAISSAIAIPDVNNKFHIRSVNSPLIFSGGSGDVSFTAGTSQVVVSGNLRVTTSIYTNGTIQQNGGSGFVGTGMILQSGKLSHSNHLILSSTAGSVVNISASMNFSEIDKTYNIQAVNSHLILSSAVGSIVRISASLGCLDTTTAALPAAADILSGSIVWDSTRKALKVYGPEGWSVIATGTTG